MHANKWLGLFFYLLAFIFTAAGCGGGGGDGGFTTPSSSLDISLRATATSLPANTYGVGPIHPAYTTDLYADISTADGKPVANGTQVQFTIVQGLESAALYETDLATTDENDNPVGFHQLNQTTGSGVARVLLHAASAPGTVTVRVSAMDPATGDTVSEEIQVDVVANVSTGNPSQIAFLLGDSIMDLNQAQTVQAYVYDDAGQMVEDPPAGTNNLRISLVADALNGGAKLRGIDANGIEREGDTIKLATVNGIASFKVSSGSIPGLITFQGTADHADNNVDNGVASTVRYAVGVSVLAGGSIPLPGDAVEITTASLPLATMNQYYLASFAAQGGNPGYSWSVVAGSLPAGLQLDATGLLQGTPTQSGSYTFMVQAQDRNGNVGQAQFTLTVNPAPTISISASIQNGAVGYPYSADLDASGGNAPYTWSIIGGSLPYGLTLDSETGVISGVPSMATPQSGIQFTVQAKDSSTPANTGNGTFSIVINEEQIYDPVVITTTDLPDGDPTQEYAQVLEAEGGNGEYTWSLSKGSLPPGLNLDTNTGEIYGLPTTVGTYNFTVLVRSWGYEDTAGLTIVIGSGSGGGGGAQVSTLDLLVDSPQIGTAGIDVATVTAVVKDANNNLVEGVDVTFAANNNGTIQVIQGTTDATGTAIAEVSAAGDKSNRTITVTATAVTLTATTDINVTGTSLTITGEKNLVFGSTVDLTFTLRDSESHEIAGQTVSVASASGNTLTPVSGSFVTDLNGQVVVRVTGTVGGADTISGSALGASASFNINVSADQFTVSLLTDPSPTPLADPEVAIDSGAGSESCAAVEVEWLVSGVPQVGQTINFSASRGAFYSDGNPADRTAGCTTPASSAVTNGSGIATIFIKSPNPGPSVVTANAVSGPSASTNITFVATTPAALDLQAERTTVPTNGDTTLTALVRDANNNVVKNVDIRFTIVEDTTGGTVAPTVDTSDTLGRANSVYTAGSISSAKDGVVVKAWVDSATNSSCDPVTEAMCDTVDLTVAAEELAISFGMANEIQSETPASYAYPGTVFVADSNGSPVANAEVTLSVIPRFYDKGVRVWNPGPEIWEAVSYIGGGVGTSDQPGHDSAHLPCVNEDTFYPGTDAYLNGILDGPPNDEDWNGSGVIETGNVATVAPTVTTNSDGFAEFFVRYAKDYASWTEAQLTATARVSGTESSRSTIFVLPPAAEDVNQENSAPPGPVSPWGTAPTTGECDDPQ